MKTIFCAVLALTVGLSFADTVELKSGSRLSGKVSAVAKDAITFASDDLGEVKIPVEKITKLDVGEHSVQRLDLSEVKAQLSVAGGKLLADGKELNLAEVKAIDPKPETWHGSVNVAFNAARGNSYEDTATVLINLNRRWEKDRFNGDLGYYYGITGKADGDNQRTKDKWDVELKHDHFWLPQVYHYEDLKWERDMIQGLEARYRVGIGGGYQWLEKTALASTGNWSFNQELGANWVKETWSEETDDERKDGFAALRYGHHLEWAPFTLEGVSVFHDAEILPQVDEWSKYLANCNVGVSTKIIYDLNLLAKIEWEFNSKPANDRKNSDVRYILGLGYKW